MMQTVGKRSRPGDLFLLAILLANLVCGVGLIGALRADLSRDVVEDESTLASSKISAFLWGKIFRTFGDRQSFIADLLRRPALRPGGSG